MSKFISYDYIRKISLILQKENYKHLANYIKVRLLPDNDVKKPQMFVFKDMDDYKTRGKNVDAEYAKMVADKKKSKIKA